MRAVPEQIRPWVPGTYITLGTDGFGFSDTRPAARRYFNTDAESVVVGVLEGLARDGNIDQSVGGRGRPQVPDRRRDGGRGLVQGHRQRIAPAAFGGIRQKYGVAFRDARQSVHPAGVHARGAGNRSRLGVAAAEAVLRAVGHRSRARHGGAVAVLRRSRGVAAGQRASGRADRGGQFRRVDAQPAEQRQLHGAGVRGGAPGPDPPHRAASDRRDGAHHDGVLRGGGAAAGSLRGAADRADRRDPAVQPRFGVRRGDRLRRRRRGPWCLGHPDGGQRRRRRGPRGHRTRAAVAGGRAELGRHRTRHRRHGTAAARPHGPGQ